jgi:hypothetical protein
LAEWHPSMIERFHSLMNGWKHSFKHEWNMPNPWFQMSLIYSKWHLNLHMNDILPRGIGFNQINALMEHIQPCMNDIWLFIIIGCDSFTMDHINGRHLSTNESNHDGYIINEDEIHSPIHEWHPSMMDTCHSIMDECFSILHNGWHPSMHEFHSFMMSRCLLFIHGGHELISYEYMYPSIQICTYDSTLLIWYLFWNWWMSLKMRTTFNV